MSCEGSCYRAVLLQGSLHDGLYQFRFDKSLSQEPAACLHATSSTSTSSIQDSIKTSFSSLNHWHFRLGHPTTSVVKQVLLGCNNSFSRYEKFNLCSSCQLGKSHKLPFTYSHKTLSALFELVYADVWGPSNTISRNGSRYYISFVDAHTRYTWIYFLKLKSEVHSVFQFFYTHVQVQFNHKIKTLQTDGGGEFRSLAIFLQTHGIHHRLSCPHTSEKMVLSSASTIILLKQVSPY